MFILMLKNKLSRKECNVVAEFCIVAWLQPITRDTKTSIGLFTTSYQNITLTK